MVDEIEKSMEIAKERHKIVQQKYDSKTEQFMEYRELFLGKINIEDKLLRLNNLSEIDSKKYDNFIKFE